MTTSQGKPRIGIYELTMGYSFTNPSKWYPEISVMRVLLTLLLLLYHSFAIFMGKWPELPELTQIPSYSVIAKLSYSCVIEGYMYIAGFVFQKQIMENRFSSLKDVFLKKLHRLIIPNLIFGLLYFILFRDFKSLIDTLITIFMGVGHLWILPFFFIIFLMHYIFSRYTDVFTELCIVFLLLPLSLIIFPYNINKIVYYFFFFLAGCYMLSLIHI